MKRVKRVSEVSKVASGSMLQEILPKMEMHEYQLISDPFFYPIWIEINSLWSHWGTFIDYSLRRIINRLTNTPISDKRCKDVIQGKMNKLTHSSPIIHISDELKQITSSSYERYVNPLLSTYDTLLDTWVVSLARSIWYNEISEEFWNKYYKLQLDDSNESTNSELKRLSITLKTLIRKMCFILSKDKTEDKFCIRTNPSLCIEGVLYGDADLLIDDCVIEFKCSKNECVNSSNFIQIMAYASLVRHSGKLKERNFKSQCGRIAILNPVKGTFYIQDISSWNGHDELIEFLKEII
jgi:hypothetical protein